MRAPTLRLLGDYAVESQVGEGTSGHVYRAVHVPTARPVALKVLRLVPDVNPSDRIAEAELLRGVRHPGILSVEDHGLLEDGRAYLVMPWLDGEDLAKRQRRSPLSPTQALHVVARIAEALHVAHAAAIVHRDIKPANIFLVGSGPEPRTLGQPTLIDFGVATRLELTPFAEPTIAGTPAYMAPEQVRGDLQVGPAADIYALGATLYELLSGRPPHEGPTLLATLARLVTSPAPHLSQVAPSIPPEVAAYVHQMLALAPEDRPADARVVAQTLDRLATRLARGSLFDSEPLSSRLGSSTQRLITSLVASGFTELALRDRALTNFRQHDADVVPLGLHALIAHFGVRRARGSEATSALHLARRTARLGVSIGVASGRAMVPPLESAQSLQFLGDVVERATLLSRTAAPGSVVCDATTVELGQHRYRFKKAAAGHYMVEARTGSGRMPVASPFVGRNAEFQAIVEAYQRCEDLSVATVVSISGDPGIGKSRLQREVVTHLLGEGGVHYVVQQRNDPYGQRRALGAALDIIRSLLRLPKGATPDVVTQAISRHVEFSESEQLTTRLDVLTQLLCNLPTDGDRDESQAIRDVLWLLMTRLVLKSLERGPVVITSEDIQWADPESLSWFEHLLSRAKDHTLLMLVTTRYEFWRTHPDAFSRHNHLKLQLSPVADAFVRKMVRTVLLEATDGAVSDAEVERVVEQAGGSPLFAEELSRLAARGTNVAIAPTLEAAIQVSLDSLDEDEADALGRLSVLGATVWDEALAHLGLDAPERVLEALTEREILVTHDVSRFSAHRERHFKHAMVRDVAYARLGHVERRELHALAADWLERVGEDAAIVAGHFDLAELPERAARHWTIAARRALNANALQDALRMAERAVTFSSEPQETFARAQLLDEIWARQDARASDRESAIAAMEETVTDEASRAYARGARARYDAARGQGFYVSERLQQVREQAERLGLYDEEARCSADLATRFAFAGEHEKAEREVRRLLELAQRHAGLMASAVNAWQVLAIVRQTQGALLEALQARRNAAGAARDAELRERESVLTSNLGFALTTLGAKGEAWDMLEKGVELATAIGSQGALRHARMLMLCWTSVFGDAPQVSAHLEEPRAQADEAAAGMWTAPARENLGILYYRGVELLRQTPGHWSHPGPDQGSHQRSREREASPDRARILLRMSARAYRNTNNHDVLPVALGMWALAEHLTHNTERALAVASEAAQLLASGAPSLLNETPIFLTLHDVHTELGDADKARAAIAAGLPFFMRRVRSLTASLYQHQFLIELDDNARLVTLATAYGLTEPYPELIAERIRPATE